MAFDSAGPLRAIAALLAALTDENGAPLLQAVWIGVPSSLSNAVGAWVALSTQQVKRVASGVLQREAAYYVALTYQVTTNQQTAELAIAATIDAFLRALYADLTLGGLATQDLVIDLSLTKVPLYQKIAEMEYRVFPITLGLVQRDSYNVTP